MYVCMYDKEVHMYMLQGAMLLAVFMSGVYVMTVKIFSSKIWRKKSSFFTLHLFKN
jgi:hypothetical protein